MTEQDTKAASAGDTKEQNAGQDPAIGQRLKKNPGNPDAKLDEALDESMDASDPPAVTQPGGGEPAPSSGFDADEEAARRGGP